MKKLVSLLLAGLTPVSYTHLDVYKRQALILGTGAGTGLSAVAEEKGGADLIIAYATGRYRMAGRLSLIHI